MSRSKQVAVGAMALGLTLASLPALPQDSLDDLERRLDAAKKAEADKQEAARSAAAAQATQQAHMAVLVIRADAPCRLSIDGESRAGLEAQEARTLEVLGGKQLIECVSTEDTEIRISQIQELPAGGKEVVLLQLAAQVENRRSARENAERERTERVAREEAAAEKARRDRREVDTYLARWTNRGNGILVDNQTGLEWTQTDNGEDVDWSEARHWCGTLRLGGNGWRLPTVDELQSIYSAPVNLITAGSSTVRVSPFFRLNNPVYWSGTQRDSSTAWYVHLGIGARTPEVMSFRYGVWALCVRP